MQVFLLQTDLDYQVILIVTSMKTWLTQFNLSCITTPKNLTGRLDFNGYGHNLTLDKYGIIALENIDKNALFPVIMKPDTDIDFATTRMEDISKRINRLI